MNNMYHIGCNLENATPPLQPLLPDGTHGRTRWFGGLKYSLPDLGAFNIVRAHGFLDQTPYPHV